MKLYWKIRWYFWDRQENKAVKTIEIYMSKYGPHPHQILYVHPDGASGPEYVVLSIEAWGECKNAITDLEPHSHIEGKS